MNNRFLHFRMESSDWLMALAVSRTKGKIVYSWYPIISH